ncbi:unnamed protein product [Nippostrongylus brasiliensis]|uniref:glutathione transferase n=1 Tax=Nippostrongylus brasiliensis TaxID=27835 RepID=A0A0N4YEJ8_NIPBR|nr:unnamed protein product [Nippostrongylus brasiliensis]
MVQYKLLYFDGRGTAEIIRQSRSICENIAEMPFGQLPVLEEDGKKLAQSFAIARYLARKFGLAGKSAFEQALVDSIADQMKDFVSEIRPYLRIAWGFDQGDVSTSVEGILLPAREKLFTFLLKFLKENKSGFLVGDSLAWADLYLAEAAEIGQNVPEFYEGFPEIKAHSDNIRTIPVLRKWLETRPKTAF